MVQKFQALLQPVQSVIPLDPAKSSIHFVLAVHGVHWSEFIKTNQYFLINIILQFSFFKSVLYLCKKFSFYVCQALLYEIITYLDKYIQMKTSLKKIIYLKSKKGCFYDLLNQKFRQLDYPLPNIIIKIWFSPSGSRRSLPMFLSNVFLNFKY